VVSLPEIVRHRKTGPFPTFASFPPIPGVSEAEQFVRYLATLTKRYCGDILGGDVTTLEHLSRNRGAKSETARLPSP